MLANNDSTLIMYFCNQSEVGDDTIAKTLNFSLDNFEIGTDYRGKMKEFKIYEIPMGAESFTHNTYSK